MHSSSCTHKIICLKLINLRTKKSWYKTHRTISILPLYPVGMCGKVKYAQKERMFANIIQKVFISCFSPRFMLPLWNSFWAHSTSWAQKGRYIQCTSLQKFSFEKKKIIKKTKKRTNKMDRVKVQYDKWETSTKAIMKSHQRRHRTLNLFNMRLHPIYGCSFVCILCEHLTSFWKILC